MKFKILETQWVSPEDYKDNTSLEIKQCQKSSASDETAEKHAKEYKGGKPYGIPVKKNLKTV